MAAVAIEIVFAGYVFAQPGSFGSLRRLRVFKPSFDADRAVAAAAQHLFRYVRANTMCIRSRHIFDCRRPGAENATVIIVIRCSRDYVT